MYVLLLAFGPDVDIYSFPVQAIGVPDPAAWDANGDGVRDVFDVIRLASPVGNVPALPV